jgi:aldehyde dehydrogenase (NAD+)
MTEKIVTTDFEKITNDFNMLVETQYKTGNSDYSERYKKLDNLGKTILKYRSQIQEALYADFKRPSFETDMVDIYPILSEIRIAKKNLRKWLKPKKVTTPMSLFGAASSIIYEPKGVVLIISPWNFPFNLSFIPFVSAIAGGNNVVIKPSEITPHCSNLIKKITEEVFNHDEVIVAEGGVDTSKQLLSLPFNHIFFTGAPEIGKVVMEAAAKNLTSVTLELGGKSPVIIDETADLELTASRICQSKFANNGQICIAPDYLFIHNSVKETFQNLLIAKIRQTYGENAFDSEAYCRIVSRKHTLRINEVLTDALENGGELLYGGKTEVDSNYISPTLISNPDPSSRIMNEEIFGPLLPITGYDNINDVLDVIRSKPKPLALYIFSKNKDKTNFILKNTRAGGGCINHCAVHFYNGHLPFGGSNNSGIGKSHGFEGFKEFVNSRSLLNQKFPTVLDKLVPPYDNFKQKIVDFTLKYL